MSATVQAPLASPGKYLTVALGAELYGISVLKVREIIRLQKITPVPQMPAYVKGVINLRGRVIPIVDLRIRFDLPADVGERTCIVVGEVTHSNDQTSHMGLIVDRVEEVANLSAADITATPEFGIRVKTECLLGMAKVRGQVTTLLDIDKIIAIEIVTIAA